MPFFVYILASRKHGTLYVGVTNDLGRRVYEHKAKLNTGFTARYGVDRLVWYAVFEDPATAIQREKTIKSWPRIRKIREIETLNPAWRDLYAELNW
jgi:putative endonuclease